MGSEILRKQIEFSAILLPTGTAIADNGVGQRNLPLGMVVHSMRL
jgi:hypothetical protein